VLHFYKDDIHFYKMIDELHRVVKINGSVFIRMASIFGIEKLVKKKQINICYQMEHIGFYWGIDM
jgi:hypothetical protein